MLKKYSSIFEVFLAVVDVLIVSGAWLFSYYLRFCSGLFQVSKGVPPFEDYLKLLVFVISIWVLVFSRFGLYQQMRAKSYWWEIAKILRANALSVLLLMSLAYLFVEKNTEFSRLVFVIFFGLSTVLTVITRVLLRKILRICRSRGYNLRYALIVGYGELAASVYDSILAHTEYGIEVCGYLTKDGNKPKSGLEPNEKAKLLGKYSELKDILDDKEIDQVIIALPFGEHDQLPSILDQLTEEMVDVKIIPDLNRFVQLGSTLEVFDGLPVVSLASTPLIGINSVLKRGFDIVVSILLMLVLAPVFLLISVLVKLTSKGPVFFVQERMGLDGKVFNIVKFRTMKLDAEKGGAKFAVEKDPRTTSIGAFLRRYSLDELPQLYNVFRGEMSLVGPRPERPVFIDNFKKEIPKYMLRHKVQAGMTGWAQVNGWRGNTSLKRRIEHDLYYVEHWSLFFDIKILLMTVWSTIAGKNAY